MAHKPSVVIRTSSLYDIKEYNFKEWKVMVEKQTENKVKKSFAPIMGWSSVQRNSILIVNLKAL
jgi:hypothetical protein